MQSDEQQTPSSLELGGVLNLRVSIVIYSIPIDSVVHKDSNGTWFKAIALSMEISV